MKDQIFAELKSHLGPEFEAALEGKNKVEAILTQNRTALSTVRKEIAQLENDLANLKKGIQDRLFAGEDAAEIQRELDLVSEKISQARNRESMIADFLPGLEQKSKEFVDKSSAICGSICQKVHGKYQSELEQMFQKMIDLCEGYKRATSDFLVHVTHQGANPILSRGFGVRRTAAELYLEEFKKRLSRL